MNCPAYWIIKHKCGYLLYKQKSSFQEFDLFSRNDKKLKKHEHEKLVEKASTLYVIA